MEESKLGATQDGDVGEEPTSWNWINQDKMGYKDAISDPTF